MISATIIKPNGWFSEGVKFWAIEDGEIHVENRGWLEELFGDVYVNDLLYEHSLFTCNCAYMPLRWEILFVIMCLRETLGADCIEVYDDTDYSKLDYMNDPPGTVY